MSPESDKLQKNPFLPKENLQFGGYTSIQSFEDVYAETGKLKYKT